MNVYIVIDNENIGEHACIVPFKTLEMAQSFVSMFYRASGKSPDGYWNQYDDEWEFHQSQDGSRRFRVLQRELCG